MRFWIESFSDSPNNDYYVNGHKVVYSKMPVAIKKVFDELLACQIWQVRRMENPYNYFANPNRQVVTVLLSPVVDRDVKLTPKNEYLKDFSNSKNAYYLRWWGASIEEMTTS